MILWSQYLQNLQSSLEIFICHPAAPVPLLETNNISPVDILSRHGLFWWLVPEKIASCLQRSGKKYRYFTWANGEQLRAQWWQHRARNSYIWCCAAKWTRETKLNRLSYLNFPQHLLSFACLVSRVLVAFSSEPSRNLLHTTIIDIKSTSCANVLSFRRARSQQPHAARDSALAAAGPSKFWRRTSQIVSLRAASCSY